MKGRGNVIYHWTFSSRQIYFLNLIWIFKKFEMNQTSFRSIFLSKQIILFGTSLSMLHMQLNRCLKMRSLGAVISTSSVRVTRGHKKSRITAPQSGKLESDSFASPRGLHLPVFTDTRLYVIAGRSRMGPLISLCDVLLVLALSCFSIRKALYGNSLPVQYPLELLRKCDSENFPGSCWWTVIRPFWSLRATPALLRGY